MRQLYWKVISSVIVASSVIVSCGGDSKGTEPVVDQSSSSGVVGSSSSTPPLSSAIISSSSGGGISSSVVPSSSSSGGGISSSVAPSSSSSGGGGISSSVVPSSSSSGGGSSSSVTPSSSSAGGGSSSSVTPSSSSWNPFKTGVSYGEFTDTRNGKVYKTVVLGGSEMFAQNLDIGTQVLGSTDQSNDGTIEKYCYNDDPTNCDKFGGLYQWSEAMGFPSDCNTNQTGSAGCASTIAPVVLYDVQQQGICPSGWHIMNETDWISTWDGGSQSTSRLKANLVWSGSNMTGFSALPGGSRAPNGTWSDMGNYAFFWTPAEQNANNAYRESIYVNSTNLDNNPFTKTRGYSVRCVKNY